MSRHRQQDDELGLCLDPSARLAQSVERKALNLVVVGSSPTVGDACRPPSPIATAAGICGWASCPNGCVVGFLSWRLETRILCGVAVAVCDFARVDASPQKHEITTPGVMRAVQAGRHGDRARLRAHEHIRLRSTCSTN